MKYFRIAGASLNQTPMDWENNLQNILGAIEQAKSESVSILVLPELAISAYGCEDAFFSDYVIEESLESLREIVKATKNITVSVGLPMVLENSLFNVVCLVQNQKILGFVAKQELAGDGVHYEPRWFKTWQTNRVVNYNLDAENYPFGDLIFEIDGVRLGFEICEDAWNGVRPALQHYLSNVDIILNPSASHFAFEKTKTRQMLVTESSRAYNTVYIYSNLLGNEAGRIVYDGEILIAKGGLVLVRNKRFSFEDFQVQSAVVEVETLRRQKKKSFNFEAAFPENIVYGNAELIPIQGFLKTKKEIQPYESVEEEFQRIVALGLFDYMRKSFSNGFVLSLSGGADSSTSAVLVAQALNLAKEELSDEKFRKKLAHLNLDFSQNIVNQLLTCVYQATDNNSEDTLESAQELALELGAEFHVWNVQKNVDDFRDSVEKSIERKLTWETDDVTLQNIQARVRAPGIWMLANIKRALLLTTSNRSESAVGYATMDGDTSGGLAPLGGIDKDFLLHWLNWAETNLNLPALRFVNSLRPSAELRPQTSTQTDEDDLMPYDILEKIEDCVIRDYQSPIETFYSLRGIVEDELLKQYIHKFYRLWAANQWKRERYAPSFHLDDKNLDPKTWCRFPILSGAFKKELRALDKI